MSLRSSRSASFISLRLISLRFCKFLFCFRTKSAGSRTFPEKPSSCGSAWGFFCFVWGFLFLVFGFVVLVFFKESCVFQNVLMSHISFNKLG